MSRIRHWALFCCLTTVTVACDEDAEGTANTDETVEANIDTIRRRIAANNTQDWETWESLHTEDAVRTSPDLDEALVGAPALRAGIEALFVTFPNYHLELVDAFGTGDRIMARIHTKATMDGPLDVGGMEIPPTGATS